MKPGMRPRGRGGFRAGGYSTFRSTRAVRVGR